MPRLSREALIVILALLAAAGPMEGQGIVDKMKERARRQAVGRAHRAADEAVDSVASAAEKTVRCLVSDAQCIKAASEAGQPVLVTGPDGQPVSPEDSAAAVAGALPPDVAEGAESPAPAGVPGENPSNVEPASAGAAAPVASVDFTGDAPGAPPQSVTVEHGTLTVEAHATEGGHWVTGKVRGGGTFVLALPAKLSPAFTLTFDYIGRSGMIAVHPSGEKAGAHALVETSGLGLINDGRTNTRVQPGAPREDGVVHHARLLGRDSTMTLYIDETPVAEATSAALARRGAGVAFALKVYGAPVAISRIAVTEDPQ